MRFARAGWMLLAGVFPIVVALGCRNEAPPAASQPANTRAASDADSASRRSGAQIWSETCSRCHNLRPPQSFSSAQWATIVHHMRVRANLTGQEARTVTEFLQASN
jgi:cytochrome c5